MGLFSSKVKVTFIDESTGKPFGVTEMPPSDLPESFEVNTTLHIKHEEWMVINAQPLTRAEFAKSKSLTLRLQRIELVDPNTILFSLPTICDVGPPLVSSVLSGDEFMLTEDDWRQFELVSGDLENVVDSEIEKIRLIHEHESVEVGWRKLHVRSHPEHPVNCDLSLEALENALDLGGTQVGIGIRGTSSVVAEGFALRGGGMTVYGVAPSGTVKVIGFDPFASTAPNPVVLERLKQLCAAWNLVLVDWCRCARARSDDPGFEQLFAVEA